MNLNIFLIFVLFFVVGCSNKPVLVANGCGVGKTNLDGVCVRQDVADYASCVRAQGSSINHSNSNSISAEVGYLAINAKAAKDVSEQLVKKYMVSDRAMLAIIEQCNKISGIVSSTPKTNDVNSGSLSQSDNAEKSKQRWNIVVGSFTGEFIFSVSSKETFDGISHWSAL